MRIGGGGGTGFSIRRGKAVANKVATNMVQTVQLIDGKTAEEFCV